MTATEFDYSWSPNYKAPKTEEPPEERPIDARLVLIAFAMGSAFDLVMYRQVASVASALLVIVVAGGLLISGRLRTVHSRFVIAASMLFGVWLGVWSSPWLVLPNLFASYGLILIGIGVSNRAQLLRLGILDLVVQPALLFFDASQVGSFVGRGFDSSERSGQRERVRAVLVGLVIAAPIVLILGSFLVAGDAVVAAVFARIFDSSSIGHVAVVSLGSLFGLVLLFRSARRDEEPLSAVNRILGEIESVVVLGSVALLYAMFVAIQVAGALGATDHILDAAADTSRWARSGFFHLLWAAGLTLSLLLILEAITKRVGGRPHPWYRRTTVAVSGLTLLIVATSFLRILAYSDTFGLTMLRLYSALFACWVGLVFVLFAVRILVPSLGRYFLVSIVAVALGMLLTLNGLNPEAQVARWDIKKSDIELPRYITDDLSNDAVPVMVDALPGLDSADAAALAERLCAREIPHTDGWLAYNYSRSQARAALTKLCFGS